MRKTKKASRWLVAGVLLALGGCTTTQQFQDFVRTELARVVSNVIGQNAQTLAQGAS